jgi:hypothetical protein
MGLVAAILLLAPRQEIRSQDWPRSGEVVYVSKALQGAQDETETDLSADPRAPGLPRTGPPQGSSPEEDTSGNQFGIQPLGTLPRAVKPPLASACQPLKVATMSDNHLRLLEKWHKKRTYLLGADWKNWVHRTRADCIKAQQRESPQTQPGPASR